MAEWNTRAQPAAEPTPATPTYHLSGTEQDVLKRAALRGAQPATEPTPELSDDDLGKIILRWCPSIPLNPVDIAVARAVIAEDRKRRAQPVAELSQERDVYRAERDHARARLDNALKLLTGIHALLYPAPIKTEDGRTMVFRPKPESLDPHETLQELSDRIRLLPDELLARGVVDA
jgi:hypothetical protein